ncbi:EamA family transporter [Curtobacterium flaccumfaciens pv. flaccumfaciens]|uniref:EamA family transporter n=1 Tax=Curtobacterium flaccumfaciens pv. flaccumfaciens TaxID=138532 RepID=A0A9Q2W2R7_9MICO|nr:EamA family transporter [Curtobacterium flaccumfaciens]MBT1540943.1 EamA family transporter [Curtobacterium flaccumfaciens pv. flaccumfaciens]
MTARDRLLAVVVAVVWGLNFPATALALEHFPPFLLAALRFTILAVPTLLFVPRPRIPFGRLLLVGLGLGVLQFSFLYLSMASGMPSGLASLVLQASAPFTVVLAGVFLRERLTGRQVVGVTVAVAALAAIALHRSQTAALLPVVLALCGALGWAIGNVATRRAGAANPLHLTLWWSVVPPVPMAVLSLVVEGPDRIGTALGSAFTAAALPAVLGLLYIVVVATLVGYGIWSRLLAAYPSSTVAPFSMLVPVVGVLASWVAFGEVPDLVEVLAGAVVVAAVLWSSRPARGPLTGAYPAPAAAPAPIDGVPVPVLSPGAGDAPR